MPEIKFDIDLGHAHCTCRTSVPGREKYEKLGYKWDGVGWVREVPADPSVEKDAKKYRAMWKSIMEAKEKDDEEEEMKRRAEAIEDSKKNIWTSHWGSDRLC